MGHQEAGKQATHPDEEGNSETIAPLFCMPKLVPNRLNFEAFLWLNLRMCKLMKYASSKMVTMIILGE